MPGSTMQRPPSTSSSRMRLRCFEPSTTQGFVDGLAALRGAAAARRDRDALGSRQRDGALGLFRGARHHHAHRHDLVERGVRRIAPAIEAVEPHVTRHFRPQAPLQSGRQPCRHDVVPPSRPFDRRREPMDLGEFCIHNSVMQDGAPENRFPAHQSRRDAPMRVEGRTSYVQQCRPCRGSPFPADSGPDAGAGPHPAGRWTCRPSTIAGPSSRSSAARAGRHEVDLQDRQPGDHLSALRHRRAGKPRSPTCCPPATRC